MEFGTGDYQNVGSEFRTEKRNKQGGVFRTVVYCEPNSPANRNQAVKKSQCTFRKCIFKIKKF
jgi:hypothetical protein